MLKRGQYCLNCLEGLRGEPCPVCGVSQTEALSSHPLFLPPGTILERQYLLGRTLGHGGFGVTYLGRDLRLDFKFAVKEYMPRDMASRDPQSGGVLSYSGQEGEFSSGLESFLSEGRNLAKLKGHPNIVSVENFIEANSTGYLVMHYIEGSSLDEHLERRGGKLPEPEVYLILMQILDGLRAVHGKSLLHRDIKPSNVYLTAEGQAKLIDFGAARQSVAERSRSLSIQLSPGYAAVEQYSRRGRRQGPWTDIYGAGATAYKLLTGVEDLVDSIERQTGDGDLVSPAEMAGIQVSAAFSDTIMNAMAVEPEDRFETVEEFQSALQRSIEAGGSVQAIGSGPGSVEPVQPDPAAPNPKKPEPPPPLPPPPQLQQLPPQQPPLQQPPPQPQPAEKRQHPSKARWLTFAGLGMALLAVAALAGYVGHQAGERKGATRSKEPRRRPHKPHATRQRLGLVKVKDFVGGDREYAIQELKAAGLRFKITYDQECMEGARCEVVSVSPKPGTWVRKNSVVEVRCTLEAR